MVLMIRTLTVFLFIGFLIMFAYSRKLKDRNFSNFATLGLITETILMVAIFYYTEG